MEFIAAEKQFEYEANKNWILFIRAREREKEKS